MATVSKIIQNSFVLKLCLTVMDIHCTEEEILRVEDTQGQLEKGGKVIILLKK